MMNMGDIQFSQIMQLCALVLILVGAYNTIMSAIKNRREEKKLRDSPVTQLAERVDRHDELLAKDKDRLDDHDKQLKDIGTGMRVMLRNNMAVTSHLINGNSTDKMQASYTEIQDYLVDRK